jgi:hypothetical protein
MLTNDLGPHDTLNKNLVGISTMKPRLINGLLILQNQDRVFHKEQRMANAPQGITTRIDFLGNSENGK